MTLWEMKCGHLGLVCALQSLLCIYRGDYTMDASIDQKSVTVIVHTSRTIQTRNQAGIVDCAVIEVSRAPRGVFGLSRALQSLHVHTRWCWYHDNIQNQ